MKRVPALLTVALLAAACGPLTPPASGPTVPLGQALTGQVSQPFGGTWAVEQKSLPAWLTVSPGSGTGRIGLTLTADRAQGTPTAADQRTLSGQVTVTWTEGTQSGKTTWTVTADQYTLTGRVVDAARVQGADVGGGAALRAQSQVGARGVIVKYRSAAAQAVALGRTAPAGTLSDAAQSTTRGTLARLNVPRGALDDLGGRRIRLETPDVEGALLALRSDPNVEYAVPNAILHAQALAAPLVPTDQYAGLQWAYKLLGYGAAWRDMEAGGYTRPVTVAVVDTGVRFDHPDLQGALYGPGEGALDVLTSPSNGDGDGPDTDPTDPNTPTRSSGSHGTHVTGIIAARWGSFAPIAGCPACSTSGVVGAAYKAPVKVLPIRVIDTAGDAEVADVVNAVRYAAGLEITLAGRTYKNPHPAQVINLSLGGDVDAKTAQPMCEAVADATRAGALVVVAAGNGYGTTPYYPAACEGAVAVGAVTLSGASAPVHAPYSNSYPQVMLSAPGGADINRAPTFFNGGKLNDAPYPDEIFSTDWDYVKDQPMYQSYAGTSQAAPQVSALAALLLSKGVTQGRDDTLARLTATATDLGARGRDDAFGYGMINAAAALGAPAVSDALGLRVQGSRGQAFQPALDALGRFTAYLPDDTFQVVGGRDRDGNGIYGETSEPRAERQAALGPANPQVDLGDLTPAP
ncbi:serine protease [Deinococcus metallilatus]|uniref:Serine protease n=1 Tax=Deinococcus metallilatus TaxID=1211322 RepID=A0AAJ5K5B6_9DEIO|nr:S8 family serine peptidase [Deinococcus metallilatus]MBB5294190.1 subtilisin family serine protease [Deinococcus metallilatus]QBY08969.1 serine protease [Deinococcus metallilatus]RXJ10113.1 serine protease [Deinococcus metallilatus]TLK27950.1 serine protease [Deinococcus metallilatus]GMA16473.1 serine protease [Deinococcus metallilatus]